MAVVEREAHGSVAVLYLNRPKRRNALSGELVLALVAALEEADEDPEVRAIVLTGRGRAFCAGGDLSGGFMTDGGVVEAEKRRGAFGRLLGAIPRLATPVIAAVQGDALGGGLGIVAACDLAVADPEARLGTPEVRVGLFPMVITATLQRAVPRKALLEMMLTGSRIDAARAQSLGLINTVSEPGAALDEALALAERIAANSRVTVGLGKRAFYQVADLPYETALEVLNGRLTLNLLTEDAMEGISAFVQKRPPAWKDR